LNLPVSKSITTYYPQSEFRVPSEALGGLVEGIAEVRSLRELWLARDRDLKTEKQLERASSRARVVLLCSHYERYIYALNENAVDALSESNISTSEVPQIIRLLHSRTSIDDIAVTSWDNRQSKLTEYSSDEYRLWQPGTRFLGLIPERILQSMKAPTPREVRRFFSYWGIPDIFDEVTRKPVTRKRLWLKLSELVEKRNGIAHGDFGVDVESVEVTTYLNAVSSFCTSSDRVMARAVSRITGRGVPW
jgi:hypothetical protein